MRPIPKELLEEIKNDPYYRKCIRHKEQTCGGRITFEHALIYAGKQINEKFAILPVCEKHHGVNIYQDHGYLDKRFHEWVALSRMNEKDKNKYPKINWCQKIKYLNKIYGKYDLTNIGKDI